MPERAAFAFGTTEGLAFLDLPSARHLTPARSRNALHLPRRLYHVQQGLGRALATAHERGAHAVVVGMA